MKLGKLSLGFATVALGIACAASSSYKVTIPADTWAGDTQLKAGNYKVQVEGNQATFTSGKQKFEVPATVEQNAKKSADTLLETSGTKLQAIDIGGTTTKIVIKDSKGAGAKAQ
jgi:hypothetical protein